MSTTDSKRKIGSNAWKLWTPGQLLIMSENQRRMIGVPAHLCSDAAMRAYFSR